MSEMKTFDVYVYTKESKIIRVKAKDEKKAIQLVKDDGEDAGKLIHQSVDSEEMESLEVSE